MKMENGLLADSAGHVYKTVLNFDVTIDSDISSGLLDLEKNGPKSQAVTAG